MEDMTPEEMGRYLAGLRRQVDKSCIVCGRPFTGVAQRKYCSHACAQRAYYRRKKASREGPRGPGQDQPGEPRTT